MTQSSIRVALIEDDPVVRRALAEVIAGSPGLVLAGEADSIATAASLLRAGADIYLLDLGLPDGSGISLIPHIRAASDARILVLTSLGDRSTVIRTIEAGADGYLLKDSQPEDMISAIRVTLEGGAPISAAAAVHLLERLRARKAEADEDDRPSLSAREAELLQLFAKGYSYKETAKLLSISPLTVGNHVRSIYRKLDVHSRSEAVYEAVRSGKLSIG